MNIITLCALCFHAVGVHFGNALVATTNPITAMIDRMKSNPKNGEVQYEGCNYLADKLHDVSQEVNILKAMADAVVNNVNDGRVLVACAGNIVNDIVYNVPKTILVHSLSPALTSALMGGLQKHANEPQVLRKTLEYVAGLHSGASSWMYTSEIHRLGGFRILHDAVDRWPHDPEIQRSAWRGLSCQAHTQLGAQIIANWGGELKGIDWLMKKLLAHPDRHYGIGPDSLDCHYEILQVANGLLSTDLANYYGPAFMKAGLLERVVHAMQVDNDLRATQDVSCKVLNWLLTRNPGLKPELSQGPLDVVHLLVDSMQRFQSVDPTPWGTSTFGASYPVIPQCTAVLEQLSSDSTGLQAIRNSRILEVLHSMRPDMQPQAQHLAQTVAWR